MGIGAAVAINVPILKNEAYIGSNANVHAGGLVIEAVMTDVKGDKKQKFGAEATAGASGKSVGIAGSLALSILDAQSTAEVRGQGREFDPGAKVDVGADTIDLGAGHGLETGDAVVYNSGGGTVIGGLVDGQTYYVIEGGTAGQIQLASSAGDAAAGNEINLLAGATGTKHSISNGAQVTITGGKEFDPSAKVDVGADTIDLGVGHGLKTGDAVIYNSGGGTVIGGLVDGKLYYVIEGSTAGQMTAGLFGWGCCCGQRD